MRVTAPFGRFSSRTRMTAQTYGISRYFIERRTVLTIVIKKGCDQVRPFFTSQPSHDGAYVY